MREGEKRKREKKGWKFKVMTLLILLQMMCIIINIFYIIIRANNIFNLKLLLKYCFNCYYITIYYYIIKILHSSSTTTIHSSTCDTSSLLLLLNISFMITDIPLGGFGSAAPPHHEHTTRSVNNCAIDRRR